MGPPASHRIARVRCYSRTDRDDHPAKPSRLSRSVATLSRRLRFPGWSVLVDGSPPWSVLQPRAGKACRLEHQHGLGNSPVRSPLLRACFLFLGLLRCFSSPGTLRPKTVTTTRVVGLPHSEIAGSGPARGSPTHIAAVPRPSSARSAEASTLRSFCLP